jgi:hypothetical protein
MLRIDGLQCGYGRIPVLRGVSITVGSLATSFELPPKTSPARSCP